MNTTKWTIDPAHSRITFQVKHLMISKVDGEFRNFDGNVDFDQNNPASTTVDIRIDASSIDTRSEDRDNHLRSAEFFNTEKYPEIIFKSTELILEGEKSAKLHGNLTIAGQSKAITMGVDLNGIAESPWGQTVAGFSGSIKINREDWGLTWNQALETGGVLVGKEITIGIELELIQEAEQKLVTA